MSHDQTVRAVPDLETRLQLRPLYLQARDLLVQRIIDGLWKPGTYLPSEPQLAAELGVSVGTIRKATEDLTGQGLLERQHGRGTRVTAHSSASSRFRFLRFVHPDGRPFHPVAHLIERAVQKPSADDRDNLDLAPRENVLVLTRTRSQNGVRLVYERIALPAKLFQSLALRVNQELTDEVYVLYQVQCGVTIVRTLDQVSIAVASVAMAEALAIDEGSPLLLVRRIAFGLDGRRTEFRQSWTAGLRYQTALD